MIFRDSLFSLYCQYLPVQIFKFFLFQSNTYLLYKNVGKTKSTHKKIKFMLNLTELKGNYYLVFAVICDKNCICSYINFLVIPTLYLISINLIVPIINFQNLKQSKVNILEQFIPSCTLLLLPIPNLASVPQLSPKVTNNIHVMCTFSYVFTDNYKHICAYRNSCFYLTGF